MPTKGTRVICARVPSQVVDLLDERARVRGITRNDIVKNALMSYAQMGAMMSIRNKKHNKQKKKKR